MKPIINVDYSAIEMRLMSHVNDQVNSLKEKVLRAIIGNDPPEQYKDRILFVMNAHWSLQGEETQLWLDGELFGTFFFHWSLRVYECEYKFELSKSASQYFKDLYARIEL